MKSDTTRRIVRSLIQLVAGGGLGALFLQIQDDVTTAYKPYIVLASSALVVVAQLVLEEIRGKDIGVARTDPHGVVN